MGRGQGTAQAPAATRRGEKSYAIGATCSSDDGQQEYAVDVTSFFEKATDEAILDLVAQDFRPGSWEAQDIAESLRETDGGIYDIFRHIGSEARQHREVGVLCDINREELLDWLRLHRPHLAERIS